MRTSFLILIVFCLSAFKLAAQKEEEKIAFDAAVNALRDGGLVVLLPTRSKTIAAMEESLENGNLSIKGRQNMEERLSSTRVIAKRDQEWLSSFFRKQYTASDLYFIYDTDWEKLREGAESGYFLNDSLAVDPTIQKPAGDYLILRKGTPDPANYQVKEALIVLDKDGKSLPPKFPSVAGLVGGIWFLGGAGEKGEMARHSKSVRKLAWRLKYLVEEYEVE